MNEAAGYIVTIVNSSGLNQLTYNGFILLIQQTGKEYFMSDIIMLQIALSYINNASFLSFRFSKNFMNKNIAEWQTWDFFTLLILGGIIFPKQNIRWQVVK